MSEWYVCVVGGEPVGPVSAELLIRGIESGKVPHDALVCQTGEKEWHELFSVPSLAAALPGPAAFRGSDAAARYSTKSKLGEGGMGEVHLTSDIWIAREVAVKVMRKEQADKAYLVARFVREARIQGQLEHPSIVPVYDLGMRSDGTVFFTMKRVKGLTLATIIHGLAQKDAEITSTYTRRRLLTAMSQVCLAVAFAHSRGVVHRDLKPENLMLGDFGEVYVLDWGVAKVLDDSWAGAPKRRVEAPPGRTQAGGIIGTPGFAAPEQVQGDPAAIGPRSDVYALGAILFELLALEPLHKGRTAEALVASTLATEAGRPSARASSVPPELDEICARATQRDPAARFPSARAIQEALERYLDGERDSERRHELAREHLKAAERALALAAEGRVGAEAQRATGMRELASALALEPANEEASRMLLRVLLHAPDELSPEAEAALREVDRQDRVTGARFGTLFYLTMCIPTPLVLWLGIRRDIFGLFFLLVFAATIGGFFWIWRTGRAERQYMQMILPLAFLLVGMQSAFFGPLVVAPGAAAATAAIVLVSIRANRFAQNWVLVMSLASVLIPAVLELTGLLPPSYSVVDGHLTIAPNFFAFRLEPTMALLGISAVLTVVLTVFGVGRAVDALVAAERRNFAQAWRLRQILPG